MDIYHWQNHTFCTSLTAFKQASLATYNVIVQKTLHKGVKTHINQSFIPSYLASGVLESLLKQS